jgi:hypothetical protein
MTLWDEIKMFGILSLVMFVAVIIAALAARYKK